MSGPLDAWIFKNIPKCQQVSDKQHRGIVHHKYYRPCFFLGPEKTGGPKQPVGGGMDVLKALKLVEMSLKVPRVLKGI